MPPYDIISFAMNERCEIYGQRGEIIEIEFVFGVEPKFTVRLDSGALVSNIDRSDLKRVLPPASAQTLGTFAFTSISTHQAQWVKCAMNYWVAIGDDRARTWARDREIDTCARKFSSTVTV